MELLNDGVITGHFFGCEEMSGCFYADEAKTKPKLAAKKKKMTVGHTYKQKINAVFRDGMLLWQSI